MHFRILHVVTRIEVKKRVLQQVSKRYSDYLTERNAFLFSDHEESLLLLLAVVRVSYEKVLKVGCN